MCPAGWAALSSCTAVCALQFLLYLLLYYKHTHPAHSLLKKQHWCVLDVTKLACVIPVEHKSSYIFLFSEPPFIPLRSPVFFCNCPSTHLKSATRLVESVLNLNRVSLCSPECYRKHVNTSLSSVCVC